MDDGLFVVRLDEDVVCGDENCTSNDEDNEDAFRRLLRRVLEDVDRCT